MIIDSKARAAHLNMLIGRPYLLGANGPEAFDCYGLSRHLQMEFFGRDCPLFEAPAGAGRFALASAIAVHPERRKWRVVPRPVDGAAVSMAKVAVGYHLGTYLAIDGGIIVHAIEEQGVACDAVFALEALGWGHLRYLMPIT